MSLVNTINNGLNQAWSSLGDVLFSVVIRREARGAYDPATGAVAVTETSYPLKAALVSYASNEVQGLDIRLNDVRCILRAADLPTGYRPQVGDMAVGDGRTWRVETVRGDSRIYWDLQLRE